MADDNLFSLDFTMPGAVEPEQKSSPEADKPEAAPVSAPALSLELVDVDAPSPAATVVAPSPAASTPAASPEPVRPNFPKPLREAAELHAEGDYVAASRRLESALKSGAASGEHGELIWLGLFEVLQDLNRRDAFDKLAMAYAKHFEMSPPTWVDQVASEAAETPDDVSRFIVPEELSVAVGPALKQMMQAARTHQVLHIDLRPARRIDDAGSTLLLRALKALDAAGREYDLDGAEALAQLIGEQLEPMVREKEALWLLLLELYEYLGQQEAFEDAAVNYAVTFEVSPASWEVRPSKLAAASPATEATGTPAGSGMPALSGELSGDLTSWRATLDKVVGPEVTIDALKLRRIDRRAAEQLLAALKDRHESGSKLLVAGLPPLPYVALCDLGCGAFAELHRRKA